MLVGSDVARGCLRVEAGEARRARAGETATVSRAEPGQGCTDAVCETVRLQPSTAGAGAATPFAMRAKSRSPLEATS